VRRWGLVGTNIVTDNHIYCCERTGDVERGKKRKGGEDNMAERRVKQKGGDRKMEKKSAERRKEKD